MTADKNKCTVALFLFSHGFSWLFGDVGDSLSPPFSFSLRVRDRGVPSEYGWGFNRKRKPFSTLSPHDGSLSAFFLPNKRKLDAFVHQRKDLALTPTFPPFFVEGLFPWVAAWSFFFFFPLSVRDGGGRDRPFLSFLLFFLGLGRLFLLFYCRGQPQIREKPLISLSPSEKKQMDPFFFRFPSVTTRSE